MTTLLRDPFFTDLAAMEQRMSTLFNRLLGGENGEPRRWMPPVDIVETEEDYVVLVDLPGVEKDDVSVELQDDVLTLSGERMLPVAGEVRRWERPSGQYVRTLTVPSGLDPDRISADYRDGVLQLRLPKPAERKPKKIPLSGGEAKELTG